MELSNRKIIKQGHALNMARYRLNPIEMEIYLFLLSQMILGNKMLQ